MAKIPVLEVFGPTIQGEGRVIGRKTMFVRVQVVITAVVGVILLSLGMEALKKIYAFSLPKKYEELREVGGDNFNHVTISGGNPALIKGIQDLVDLFEEKNIYTALETQGSKFQPWMTQINDLTISPKPPSSTMKPI